MGNAERQADVPMDRPRCLGGEVHASVAAARDRGLSDYRLVPQGHHQSPDPADDGPAEQEVDQQNLPCVALGTLNGDRRRNHVAAGKYCDKPSEELHS